VRAGKRFCEWVGIDTSPAARRQKRALMLTLGAARRRHGPGRATVRCRTTRRRARGPSAST
jgi:hypothetical protein